MNLGKLFFDAWENTSAFVRGKMQEYNELETINTELSALSRTADQPVGDCDVLVRKGVDPHFYCWIFPPDKSGPVEVTVYADGDSRWRRFCSHEDDGEDFGDIEPWKSDFAGSDLARNAQAVLLKHISLIAPANGYVQDVAGLKL